MNTTSSSTIGRIAITIAILSFTGLAFIALFYTIGGPFGTLNDLCVAFGAILSGGLAWMLSKMHRSYAPRLSRLALGSGLVGAFLAPIGSSFAIFDVTGWVLAGLVTTFGYALIGLWLLGLNYSVLRRLAFPRHLAQFGVVAGGIATVGILAGPGIIVRTDALESAQWFVLAGLYVGGLGWNILYAIWCIWLGLLLLSNRLALQLYLL